MLEAIYNEIDRIENIHNVEVLYAVESGSRVWGFESPNSDYDVRFIYKRPLSWYLAVHERRDVIEMPLKDGVLDVTGWDLRKALYLLSKSNPPLLEWLSSPIVYQERGAVATIRKFVCSYFNPQSTIYHYLHMAQGNYREYLRTDEVPLKKYFYVIRPLLACAWIAENQTFPPVRFDELTVKSSDYPQVEVDTLLGLKKAAHELGTGPRVPTINRWIEKQLDIFAKVARTTPRPKFIMDDLDEVFLNAVTGDLVWRD
jgi:uncharacterized protein